MTRTEAAEWFKDLAEFIIPELSARLGVETEVHINPSRDYLVTLKMKNPTEAAWKSICAELSEHSRVLQTREDSQGIPVEVDFIQMDTPAEHSIFLVECILDEEDYSLSLTRRDDFKWDACELSFALAPYRGRQLAIPEATAALIEAAGWMRSNYKNDGYLDVADNLFALAGRLHFDIADSHPGAVVAFER